MLKGFFTVEICLLKHNCIGQSSYHKTKKTLLISSPKSHKPLNHLFAYFVVHLKRTHLAQSQNYFVRQIKQKNNF